MSIETELAALNAATADLITKTVSLETSANTLLTKASEAADSEAVALSAADTTQSLFNRIYLGAY